MSHPRAPHNPIPSGSAGVSPASGRKPRNPIPYIGGKAALAPKLAALLPPHHVYVEVFGGVAHLLFRKERSPIEVYNDRDARLVNLFHVLRDHHDDFAARLRWVVYARSIHGAWRRADRSGDPIDEAVRTFVLLKCSMNGDLKSTWSYGRVKSSAAMYERSKQEIRAVADRFLGVAVEERDFRLLIPRWDSPDTLFFCDPPYYGPVGAQFWTFADQDHADLASLLHQVQGKVMLTYYDHPAVRGLYPAPTWRILEHRRPRRGAVVYGRPLTYVTELIITSYDPPQPSAPPK